MALKFQPPTSFRVVFGPFLWTLSDDLRAVIMYRTTEMSAKRKLKAAATASATTVCDWKPFTDSLNLSDWAHQTSTIDDLMQRTYAGFKGHFVWIPVGLGKTRIVIKYMETLRSEGELSEYCIYLLPSESIRTIADEFAAFGHQVQVWNPTKSAQAMIRKQLKDDKKKKSLMVVDHPKPFTVVLLSHDHVRSCLDELLKVLGDGQLIVDEVHKALNNSQRTSGCLRSAHTCNRFVALTGTPVIDNNLKKLIGWFKLICNYPVNARNFWVAAMNMLTHRVDIGVKIERVRHIAKLNTAEHKRYVESMPPKIGGRNAQASRQDLSRGMDSCNTGCDRELIALIHQLVTVDKRRGVFAVAENTAHQTWIRDQLLLQKGWKEDHIICVDKKTSVNLTSANQKTESPNCRCVITTIQKSNGYTVSRFDTMVWRVYPCNQATREQQEGRIARIGQLSTIIYYITVVDSEGFYDRVLERHNYPRQYNEILKFALDDKPITTLVLNDEKEVAVVDDEFDCHAPVAATTHDSDKEDDNEDMEKPKSSGGTWDIDSDNDNKDEVDNDDDADSSDKSPILVKPPPLKKRKP